MTSELQDRLTDLAVHSPSGTPPPDLWARGVRRRRAGQAITSFVVVALLLLVGAGGVAWNRQRPVQPAAPHGQAQFPDRFYAPSPWLKDFAKPPGPLVAILPEEQKSLFHTGIGLVGITASQSTYGFLDLPSSAVVQQGMSTGLALSPGGTQVAFWVTGTTSGTPNTQLLRGSTVTGIGTYDTGTGKTRVDQIPSVHGLDPIGLIWTDDSTLVFGYARITNAGKDGNSSATYVGTYLWARTAPQPERLPEDGFGVLDKTSISAAAGTLLTARGRHDAQLIDPHTPSTYHRFRVEHAAQFPALSPDLQRLVGMEDPGATQDGSPQRLMTARIPPESAAGKGVASYRRVPGGAHYFATAGWTDAGHAVALRPLAGVRQVSIGDAMADLARVDVRTGQWSKLSMVEMGANVADPYNALLAQSLLSAPVAHATPPPSPLNERLLYGLVTAIVWLGAVLVVRIRRGRRA